MKRRNLVAHSLLSMALAALSGGAYAADPAPIPIDGLAPLTGGGPGSLQPVPRDSE